MSLSSLAASKPLPGRTTTALSQPFDLAPAVGEQLPGRLAARIAAVYVPGDTVSARSVSRGGEPLGFVVCLHPRPKRPWSRDDQRPKLIMPWSETAQDLELQPDSLDGLNTALAELARQHCPQRRRPVTAQDQIDVTRDDVIQIAKAFRDEQIDVTATLTALSPYYPQLNDDARADRLGDLIGALDYQQRVTDYEIDPEDGETRDGLKAAAEHLVDTAADALIGDTQ